MAGQVDEYGLTPKQRAFAEKVSEGQSLADAYRHAYDTSSYKVSTVHRSAVKLMRNDKVVACVNALGAKKREEIKALTTSDRDMLLGLLRDWSRGKEATSSQLRAAELLGKACGLYREVIEDHRERPASEVARELEIKLATLADDDGAPMH